MALAVTIRPATIADIPAITNLWVELIDMHAALDSDFTRGADAPYRYSQIVRQQIGAKNEALVLVVEEEAEIIGYALATICRAQPLFTVTYFGEIVDFIITSSRRRSGVGRLLYTHVASWFKERGISYVELRASIYPRESNPFWQRMGFTPTMYLMNKKG